MRLVQKALGRRGFEVRHAANRAEALAQIATGEVDVVALDHYLTDGTGLDFLAQLAELDSAPPVVYVTGSSEMNVAVAALKAGATDFVPKTVGDDFLILLGSALEQAVEKARLRAEKEAAEQEVRAARDRAELLLAEVNHRVANSLALVAALVGLQANAVKDQVAKDALGETQARIYAISLVHKRLYSSGDVRFVALDEYLSGLLDHLERSMRDQGHGASSALPARAAEAAHRRQHQPRRRRDRMGHQCIQICLSGPPGEIRVRLQHLPDGRVELAVEDDGVGREDGSAKGPGSAPGSSRRWQPAWGRKYEYLERKPGTLARLIFSLQGG